MFKIVILAGGMATRLLPITQDLPKALIDVCGEPFISRQLNYIKEQGIDEVILCLGHLCDQVICYLESQNKFGLNIQYVEDGGVPLGTGGAVRKSLPLLQDNFFVMYGDSYLPTNFLDVQSAFVKSKKSGLLTIFKNEGRYDSSNVSFEKGTLTEYNKACPTSSMSHIDYGLSILSKDSFDDFLDVETFDLAEIYRQLSLSGELLGFEIFERFYEIGSFEGLSQTREYFERI